jgi:hypothetical protein
MSGMANQHGPDEALERIETAILPSISIMLDQLIETGRTTTRGEGDARAAELRMMALQLEALVYEMNALSLAQVTPDGYAEARRATISA